MSRRGRLHDRVTTLLAPLTTPRGLATASAILLAAILVLGASTVWPPAQLDPGGEDPADTNRFAQTAADTGYDVQTVLVDPGSVDGLPASRTLHVILVGAGQIPPIDTEDLDQALEDGQATLVTGGASLASLTQPWGWHLDPTPVYASDVGQRDPLRVNLQWPGLAQHHTVAAHTPYPLRSGDDARQAAAQITTTNRSFADLDLDGTLDEQDIRGPFTVGLDVTQRQGRLTIVTSPTVLTNDVAEDAQPFRRDLLLAMLPQGGTVVLDASAAPRPALAAPGHTVTAGITQSLGCTPCTLASTTAIALAGAWVAHTKRNQLDGWTNHETTLHEVHKPHPDEDPFTRSEHPA